jgi:PAS domain S-box-containing protein
MKQRQDWEEMRRGIIGLGEESSRRSYYPELLARLAELERLEEGLSRSEANLWSLFNSLNDALVIHDPSGRIIEANDTMLAMYGLTREEVRDYTLFDLTAGGQDSEQLRREVAEHLVHLARDSQAMFSWHARRPHTGEAFDVEVSTTGIRWHGQPALAAMVRDVTARRRLEAQLNESQKRESLGQLAGGVAHDTNNMLGVILGYAELLLEDAPEGSRQRHDLEQIRKAATSSAALIRQLLAFARRQPIQPVVVDLNLLVENTRKMLRRLVGEQYHMDFTPASGLWLTRIDPAQLEQVLTNLCLNARDAIEPGQGIALQTANVTVDEAYAGTHPDARPGEFVALVVSDNGAGMAPEVQGRMFEPFFSTKAKGQGTGLGLATVYGIVRQNEGFITVYSHLGVGTTIRVHFPRHLDREAGPAHVPEEAAPEGRESILLVEDEMALLELGKRLLEGAGYRVTATPDPLEALRLAEDPAFPIDLLATDLVMPGLNGRQLHERIHSLRPGLRTLFLSGYPAGTISLEQMPAAGLGYLPKPFSRNALLRKVREVLD